MFKGLVLWYHDEALVVRDSSRVSVATTTDEITVSVLSVASARDTDSGNYSCWPSAGAPDSILLHVIKGKQVIPISYLSYLLLFNVCSSVTSLIHINWFDARVYIPFTKFTSLWCWKK